MMRHIARIPSDTGPAQMAVGRLLALSWHFGHRHVSSAPWKSWLRYFKSEVPYTANDVVQIELPASCICVTSIPMCGRFRRPSCVT